jgi:hypothetical protein
VPVAAAKVLGVFGVRLIFDPATLYQSGSRGSITAVIYYDFGDGRQFPEEDWNDFVVVILNWWIEAMEQAAAEPVKLYFMDGPFWMTAVPEGEDSLRLSCVEDRRGAGTLFEVVVKQSDLRRELMTVARSVSSACASAGFESADLNELRTRLRE